VGEFRYKGEKHMEGFFRARWPQNLTINTSAIAAPATEFLDTTTTTNNSLTATHTMENMLTNDITHNTNNTGTIYSAEEVNNLLNTACLEGYEAGLEAGREI
jgi:hypothetical protein